MNARLEELRSKFQENPRRYFAPFANELRKAGDTAQAISVCRAHLAGQPGHVSGHIVLGQALYEAGEASEARDIFTAALELDPENLIALRTLGEIAQVNGEFGAARQWYERLLDADPRNNEVAQFLKDLPPDAPSTPEAASAVDVEEAGEADRLPYNARPEAEAAPPTYVPTAPAPTFHTSFTGSSAAISSEPDEPAREESSAETAHNAPVDFAAPEPDVEPVAASAEPAEAIEMVDFDSFSRHSPEPEPETEPVAYAPPDESFESQPDEELDDAYIVDFDPASLEAAAEPMATAGTEPVGEPEAASEPDAAAPATEPPRAIFAEFGFDGPADDQIGWMTTPSASLSEPESAPETWFDETATSEDAAPSEAEANEPTSAELITPEPATDSWFDDVAGAAVIETTVVSNEEFWLPPELSSVPTSASPETETVPAQDESPSAELAPEITAHAAEPAAEPTVAAAELHNDYAENAAPEHLEAASEAEEPALLESSDSPALTYWSEPVEAAQDAPEEPAHAEHASPASESYWTDPVAAAPSESSTMEQERAEEPATLDWSEPAVAEAAATPVVESSYPAPPALSYYSTPMPEPEAEVTEPELEMVGDPAARYQADEAPAAAPVAEYAPSDEAPEAAISEAPEHVNEPEEFARSASITEAMPPSEVVMGLTPASVAVVPPSAPAPFVTETLAELYMQQGFRDEALSIYRQLVERDPANPSLRDRVAQLERGDLAATAGNVNEPPVENRASSQSVRSFFSRLARRSASTPTRSTESDDASKANPDVPFAAAASALANLFSASRPPASDEGAASTLAGAFTDPAGRPSRAADRELSLDHLFRDVPPGGSAGGSVSLDEFYATPDATQDSSTESGEAAEPGAGEPGSTDIRQFTAWLEGLRKK